MSTSLPTVRITSQHLQTAQYQGQAVRAVGKLTGVEGEMVQLQLAGEGARATPRQPGRPRARRRYPARKPPDPTLPATRPRLRRPARHRALRGGGAQV